MTQTVKGMLLTSLKILILFVPFFLRLDILWAFMFWSILLWGYVIKRERVILLIFLILLVYLPFFLRSASSFLDGPQSEIILQMSQMNQEDWDRTLEKKLEAWLSEHPNDADVLFTLALIGKRRKLVPTRWSITASDDTVGNALKQSVLDMPLISDYYLYSGEELGNHFEILLMPRAFFFELIEIWLPRSVWTRQIAYI